MQLLIWESYQVLPSSDDLTANCLHMFLLFTSETKTIWMLMTLKFTVSNFDTSVMRSPISMSHVISMPWKGPGELEAGFSIQSQMTRKRIPTPVTKRNRIELRPTSVANRQPLRLPTVHLQLIKQTVANEVSKTHIRRVKPPDARHGKHFCTVSSSGQQEWCQLAVVGHVQ